MRVISMARGLNSPPRFDRAVPGALIGALIIAAALLGGCTRTKDDDTGSAARGTRIGTYLVVNVTDGGTIAGRVTVTGDVAVATAALGVRHVSNGQTECCDGATTKPQQKLMVHGSGLRDVVVSLVRCDSGIAPRFARTTLDQHFCDFEPHVVAVMVGDSVTLLNGDPIVHAVHGYRGVHTLFNIATPQQGTEYHARCADTGVTRCLCDAGHVWMEAFIHVLPNPYFAVTGDDGSFTIEHVPPGTYALRYSHELWSDTERSIVVPAAGRVNADLSLDLHNAVLGQ